jgi:hypothetical protein
MLIEKSPVALNAELSIVLRPSGSETVPERRVLLRNALAAIEVTPEGTVIDPAQFDELLLTTVLMTVKVPALPHGKV